MPIVGNRFYNDPNLGAAFSGLAQMFAPPTGQESAAWAQSRLLNQKSSALANLMAGQATLDHDAYDRAAVAAGLYNPTQGYTAQDMNNATTQRGQDVSAATERRGQDVTASTALATNRADNNTKVTEAMLAPVGEGATRFVPKSLADMYAVPQTEVGTVKAGQGDTVVTPDGRTILGQTKPKSEDEVKAAILGSLPIAQQQAIVASQGNVEDVVGPDGKPKIVARSDAIGQQPAPKGPSTVINNGGGSDAQVFSAMGENFKDANSAQTALQSYQNVQKVLASGDLYTGTGAEAKLNLAKIGAALGYPNSAIANTETLRAQMAPVVLSMVRGLGAGSGISNADREFAERAAGGNISLDETSIKRLVDIGTRAAQAKISNYNATLNEVYPEADTANARTRALYQLRSPGGALAPGSSDSPPQQDHDQVPIAGEAASPAVTTTVPAARAAPAVETPQAAPAVSGATRAVAPASSTQVAPKATRSIPEGYTPETMRTTLVQMLKAHPGKRAALLQRMQEFGLSTDGL